MGSTEIEELPEGAFGEISFQEMYITDNEMLRSIHSTALLPSKDRLKILRMERNHLNSFPFDILPVMTELTNLTLYSNYLTYVPVINSDSLQLLHLANNQIVFLEDGSWSLPNLKELQLGMSITLNLSINPIGATYKRKGGDMERTIGAVPSGLQAVHRHRVSISRYITSIYE